MASADSMLAEIQSESLQSLLTLVRSETSPLGSTHIHALDGHFFAAVQRHPSTLSSLNHGDVIEIQGPAASGKTHLLYHFVITSITPIAYLTTKLGGWDKAVVIFDTDGSFNISRLHKLLLHRLARLIPSGSVPNTVNASVEDFARAAMKRVHIFRPTSSVQLAISLLNLPTYHVAHLPEDEIGLIAIDSISSFYWPDRFTLEQMNSSGNTARGQSSAAGPMYHVLIALQKIRISHGPVIALTNWGLNPLTQPTYNSPLTTFYKQHLFPFPTMPKQHESNAPYTAEVKAAAYSNPNATALPPLTHHITLPFVSITPFGPSMSLDEAKEQESIYRSELVMKGEVVGVVRTLGSTRVGRFTFRITADEVLVDDLGT